MKYSRHLCVDSGSPIYLREGKKQQTKKEDGGKKRRIRFILNARHEGKRERGEGKSERPHWGRSFRKVGLTIRERDVTHFNPFSSRNKNNGAAPPRSAKAATKRK